MEERLKDAKRRMQGAVAALGSEFASVRTGRASTALLDRVTVDAYGTRTPLNQLATINAPEPRLLTIQPFDRSIMQSVEKAIMESDLGLTPNNDGQTIRLADPAAHRGAAQGDGPAGPQDGRGGPQSRCATCAATCSTR